MRAKREPTMMKCGACEEEAQRSSWTARADGHLECPSCGAPAEAAESKSPDRSGDFDEQPAKEPDRKYCGECGSEWSLVKGKPFINCGHMRAERIADPRKASNYNPPAGMRTRSDKERERLDAEDAAAKRDAKIIGENIARNPLPGTAAESTRPSIEVSQGRVSVTWGKSIFPTGPYASITVGELFRSTELAEGADPVAVGVAMLAELQAIADRAFAMQLAWYEEKLAKLTK